MLYWYALQNLGMGTYTLPTVVGSGGFTIGGIAVVVVTINKTKPKKVVVIYQTGNQSEQALAQINSYLKQLARLDGITPLPPPPKGVTVIESRTTPNPEVQLNDAIMKAKARLARLEQITEVP